MQVFTYSEARQNLAKLLQLAQHEEVEIRRKDGSVFALKAKAPNEQSPFAETQLCEALPVDYILDAVRSSRAQD